jgi:hypothetical protein
MPNSEQPPPKRLVAGQTASQLHDFVMQGAPSQDAIKITYEPILSIWAALIRCSAWTLAVSFFALLPIIILGASSLMASNNQFKLSDYFQNGTVMIFVLGLLCGLAMDYLLDPRKDRLKVKEYDCKRLFSVLPIIGIACSAIALIVVLSNQGHITPLGEGIEKYLVYYALLVAIILKFVVFASM